ncbi:MAG TPA: EI24 domain-containing protein [Rhizomicrobium sp.]|jgi:CysZ protein|nr:EI24 domain-containing protein [Rhizomicrobium sp.]
MFASMTRALRLLGSPAALNVLLKSIGLTLLLFVLGFLALEYGIALLPQLGSPAVNSALEWLAPVLFLVLLWLLGGPVAALFAGLFLEGLAARIEATDYPNDPPAPGMGFWTGLRTGAALALLVLCFDIALLPLDAAFPGPAELATLLGNGWLLGREYFELAVLRHLPREAVAQLRRRYRGRITMGGIAIAFFSMLPLLNLIAPLFGVALMVHLFKRIQHEGAP